MTSPYIPDLPDYKQERWDIQNNELWTEAFTNLDTLNKSVATLQGTIGQPTVGPPQNLLVNAPTATSIRVSISAPNGATPDSYIIRFYSLPDGTVTVINDITNISAFPYTISSGVSANTTYRVSVTAVRSGVESTSVSQDVLTPPSSPPASGMPVPNIGVWYPGWGEGPDLGDVDPRATEISIFAMVPDGGPPGSTGAVHLAYSRQSGFNKLLQDVAYKRSLGVKVTLTLGGAGSFTRLDTAGRVTACFNSIVNIIDNDFGGAIDGFCWNMEYNGTTQLIYETYAVSLMQQLKDYYGENFFITFPPAPWKYGAFPYYDDGDLAEDMFAAGVIDGIYPQFYDQTDLTTQQARINNALTEMPVWAGFVDDDWSKVGPAFQVNATGQANGSQAAPMSYASAKTVWDTLKAAHSDIAGFFVWNSGQNLSAFLDVIYGSVIDDGGAAPALSTLTDDFGSEDTAKWSGYTSGASVSGGELKLPATSYSATANAILSVNAYDARAASVTVRVNGLITAGTECYFTFGLQSATDPSKFVQWRIYQIPGSNTIETNMVNGTAFYQGIDTYNSTNDKYFRMRVDGGNWLWETAPDSAGVPGSWTTRRTLALTNFFDLSNVRVSLRAEGEEAGNGDYDVDKFNIVS